jgi:hypothetical protein
VLDYDFEIKHSVGDLIEQQRTLSVSANPFKRVVGSLVMAGRLKQKLATLPDESVGQLMVDVVWNVMDVFSPELAICQVATDRLRNSSSVVTTEKENLNQ